MHSWPPEVHQETNSHKHLSGIHMRGLLTGGGGGGGASHKGEGLQTQDSHGPGIESLGCSAEGWFA